MLPVGAITTRPAALLFVLAIAILIGALLGAMVAGHRRREREAPGRSREASDAADAGAVARLVGEGRQLFELWQARIERMSELRERLVTLAQQAERLEAQVRRMDALQAENLRLHQQAEALLLERDQLLAVLARIGELLQLASERGPATAGRRGETA